jgi:endoglucanase
MPPWFRLWTQPLVFGATLACACSTHHAQNQSPADASMGNDTDSAQPDSKGDAAGPHDGADASKPSGSSDGGGAGDGDASKPAAADIPWLSVSGTKIVAGKDEVLLRGLGVGELFNIENYFLEVDGDDLGGMGASKFAAGVSKAIGADAARAFFDSWEHNLVGEADISQWKAWGVNSVRLPLNHHQLSSKAGSYDEDGFKRVDRFVTLCKAAGIYVILDLHAAPGAQNTELMSDSPDGVAHLWKEPEKYRQWTIDLWQTIAKRYANEPAVGGYDLLDEPFDDAASGSFAKDGAKTILRPFYLDVTKAIRSVDARHILFVEGGDDWAKGFSGLEPAWDEQLVWTFHKYWDDNDVASIQTFLDLRTRTKRPLWNGETGEDEQDGWSRAMIALLEQNDIGWNEWTYKKLSPNATNPYSITAPAGWADMADFLASFAAGKNASAPNNAAAIMSELADNARTEKCTCNPTWVQDLFAKSCD